MAGPPATGPPRHHRGRWRVGSPVGWLVGGLLALLLAAAAGVAIGEASGWPVLRGPLQRQASRAAGVPVQFDGAFQLRLLAGPGLAGGWLRVGRLQVGPAQGVPAPHLLQAEGALLAWRWTDLWRWSRGRADTPPVPLRIAALTAQTLDLRLLRLADGRATWALGSGARPAVPAQAAPLPRVGRLQLGRGQVVVDDALTRTVLQARVQGGEGGEGGEGGGAGEVAGDGGIAATPAAPPNGYTARITGRWQALPLDLALRTGGALPLLQDDADGSPGSPALALRVEGTAGAARLLFDGEAAALLGNRRLAGTLRFSGPSLAAVGAPLGLTLPRTPAFQLQGRLAQTAGLWHLQADSATIGRSALGGDFHVDTRSSPPRLAGQLRGSRLLLADLGPAVGTPGEGRGLGPDTAPPPVAPGKLLPQRGFDLPALRAMDAGVAVAIDTLDLGSRALAPLQAVRGRVLLQGGVLQLQGLQAGVAGGQVAADTRLDGRASPARWSLDLRVQHLDMAGWVRALQAPAATPAPQARGSAALQRERRAARQGGDQPVRSYLTGLLDGHAQLQGQGTSTAQILATLQGRASLQLQEGTLSHLVTEAAGIDLAQVLGVLVRGDRPLPLRCARAELTVDNGLVLLRRAVLDNADSTLRLDGQVDLRTEALALRARSRPKDFSPLALRAPLLVTGTLARPQLGLDGRALGARAAAAAALAVVAAPLAALLPFVDTGADPAGDPCADPPRALPAPR